MKRGALHPQTEPETPIFQSPKSFKSFDDGQADDQGEDGGRGRNLETGNIRCEELEHGRSPAIQRGSAFRLFQHRREVHRDKLRSRVRIEMSGLP